MAVVTEPDQGEEVAGVSKKAEEEGHVTRNLFLDAGSRPANKGKKKMGENVDYLPLNGPEESAKSVSPGYKNIQDNNNYLNLDIEQIAKALGHVILGIGPGDSGYLAFNSGCTKRENKCNWAFNCGCTKRECKCN
ncbi:hypothetical protein COLO4_05411 [Corchorus olitorius]|uniref:Uncharacterized protein n=1 Tax=Corchorus olitorius TaxID=93759 RepID=A0A1R3KQX1_9ROSI|nr:hypothetical protein COLO4_05411 [Corchorus olitorius]